MAVAFAQRTRQTAGGSQRQVASQLEVSDRTLRNWKRRLEANAHEKRFDPPPRGRPPLACDADTRNAVIRFLHQITGPVVGLPALRPLFPSVPRVILAELLGRYRRVWRRRYRQSGFRLTWHHAGAVWAIDFSQPRCPIDGVYDYLLAVRDLASHQQLAWLPVFDEKAATIVPILQQLFDQHGPPLVLKSDNGSAFIAAATQDVLREGCVAQLFSPPRRPSYNGALERSNGTLKTYTHQHAVLAGHPFQWTSDDLEQARQLANTISRPWGYRGSTPHEAWQQRSRVSDAQRAHFRGVLAEQRLTAAADLGLDETPLALLSANDVARLDRLAVSRTLEQLGYLTKARVTRPHDKPRRLARDALTRRAADYFATSPSPAPTKKSLATPPRRDTIHAPVADGPASEQSPVPQPPRPLTVSDEFLPFEESPITPPVSRSKAANIM